MAYTLPLGSAAHFVATGTPKFPVSYNALNFKFTSAGYTSPVGNGVPAQFPPAPPDWPLPLGNAVNFTTIGTAAWIGIGSVAVGITAAGQGTFTPSTITGSGSATFGTTAGGLGAHGVAAHGAASLNITATGRGLRGTTGTGSAAVNTTAVGHGTVVKYEVAGEVRIGSTLFDRTVRVYRRDTGALVAEQATTAGRFRIFTGFTADEHYLLPIDLSGGAEDWSPPCANRVIPVLVVDTV